MWAFESLLIWAETLISFITKLRYKTQHKCMHEHCFFFFIILNKKTMSIHIVEQINARTQRKTCCNAKHVAMLRIMGGMTKDMNENKIQD